MALAMTAAALVALTVATAALMVIAVATAAALMLSVILMLMIAIGVAVLAIAVATTTARASAHLLLHAVSNLLISGSFTLFNSKAKVLINSGQKLIKLLASLQETTAGVIFNHILTQGIKLGNFLL
jgi:hypothetical protein